MDYTFQVPMEERDLDRVVNNLLSVEERWVRLHRPLHLTKHRVDGESHLSILSELKDEPVHPHLRIEGDALERLDNRPGGLVVNEDELLRPVVLGEDVESTDDPDPHVTQPNKRCLHVSLGLDYREVLVRARLFDPLHVALKHDSLEVGLRQEDLELLGRHVLTLASPVRSEALCSILQEVFKGFLRIGPGLPVRHVVLRESRVDILPDGECTER